MTQRYKKYIMWLLYALLFLAVMLVLSIFFGFLEPFFIFFNRNREWGMPPRRAAEAEPVYDTVYQTAPEPTAEPRTYQDPWENN